MGTFKEGYQGDGGLGVRGQGSGINCPDTLTDPKHGTLQNDLHYYIRETKGLIGRFNLLDPSVGLGNVAA